MAEGNPHIRVEVTGEREFHCFRVIFNAKPDPDGSERSGIEVMLHATDLVDLIHKASTALCAWQAEQSEYLLKQLLDAREAGFL
jgi:hypothetical protein